MQALLASGDAIQKFKDWCKEVTNSTLPRVMLEVVQRAEDHTRLESASIYVCMKDNKVVDSWNGTIVPTLKSPMIKQFPISRYAKSIIFSCNDTPIIDVKLESGDSIEEILKTISQMCLETAMEVYNRYYDPKEVEKVQLAALDRMAEIAKQPTADNEDNMSTIMNKVLIDIDKYTSCDVKLYEDKMRKAVTRIFSWLEEMDLTGQKFFNIALIFEHEDVIMSGSYEIKDSRIYYCEGESGKPYAAFENEMSASILLDEGKSAIYGVGISSNLQKAREPIEFFSTEVSSIDFEEDKLDIMTMFSCLTEVIPMLLEIVNE